MAENKLPYSVGKPTNRKLRDTVAVLHGATVLPTINPRYVSAGFDQIP